MKGLSDESALWWWESKHWTKWFHRESVPTRAFDSLPEARLFEELHRLEHFDLHVKYPIPAPWARNQEVVVDIAGRYKSQWLAIEYDGIYWHQGRDTFDTAKTHWLLQLGYRVVRIRQGDRLKMHHPNLLQLTHNSRDFNREHAETAAARISRWVVLKHTQPETTILDTSPVYCDAFILREVPKGYTLTIPTINFRRSYGRSVDFEYLATKEIAQSLGVPERRIVLSLSWL